ncbi:hypothetical protein OESDEN_04250 [Oesophagostomum dentatum]|uniref:Protein kinase domain-containing protein n=1 Tax=Oesophagostomum dentatum TaxID=61180 RepID=A0A0B1TJ06_OESDE|nr:hypothetical protein OESDEN_04250 [Oesophagostomum dentatum]
MRKPPVVVCEVIVNNDKKTVKDELTLTVKRAPKKRFLQAEAKFNEKRRKWIIALVQELLANHHENQFQRALEVFCFESNNTCLSESVRHFLSLREVEDYDEAHVDLGPKEHATASASHFDFLNTIGKGNFGRVYQVRHVETGKIYAMKVLSKEHIRKKNEVKHVMAELNVLKSNIHHPFLVSLHFSFQSKDKLFFVLDHLNGGERMDLHSFDVFRDLKPENLLLDKYGYLVLTDFGLCKENMGPDSVTATFCGTPE